MKTRLKIRLSPSQQICDPFGMSQDCLKFVRFEGFPPTQDYLDLISGYLSYIESILCVSPISGQSRFTTIFNLQSITLNLTAFQKLKTFRMDIQTLVGYNGRNAFGYLFFHIKYAGQEEEEEQVLYSLRKGDRPYKLTPTTQRFILDACQNEEVSTKLVVFECSGKLEEFTLAYSVLCLAEFRFGILSTTEPDIMDFHDRFM